MSVQMDQFEDRLLNVLQSELREARVKVPAPRGRTTRTGRRWALAGGTATLAAGIGASVFLGSPTAAAAYTLSTDSDNSMVLRIGEAFSEASVAKLNSDITTRGWPVKAVWLSPSCLKSLTGHTGPEPGSPDAPAAPKASGKGAGDNPMPPPPVDQGTSGTGTGATSGTGAEPGRTPGDGSLETRVEGGDDGATLTIPRADVQDGQTVYLGLGQMSSSGGVVALDRAEKGDPAPDLCHPAPAVGHAAP